ncbi:sulfatase-like hydrolase/transferase [Pseudoteredinibacter isoporae]|uniref:Arylsulfatase A-like enzyme n=1 Tax=Pseudoteredinibacter isoporae TaxID=570281 RepID=A0A7X0MTS0_9GAMM|nr:sulfatase-like hydrolase/transferase [Pseudoteredinibacter isoporae]MBB6519826.1 arylsulfatase A-like enzyme [Pseudoteredinibacter isoporae]NHO85406.1 sulfatase-like hydrolase/transferase [Pseudoteredinibacter isoporae]NIB26142.1 sulfatase-like hydrolase/transferase [Pseudoteredinibacter isoporae]
MTQVAFAKQHAQAPNIVLIVADYMGYSDIGPYGASDIETPSLDSLAEQGVLFSDHYSSAPKCIPARASLMSGLYPAKALDRGRGLPAEKNILLKSLKAKNYRTALIGKWHLGMSPGYNPNDHGFDYFLGFNSWTLGHHDHKTPRGEPGLYRNGELVSESGYLTDVLTREAVSFIRQSSSSPFFLYLSYSSALPPYQVPDLPKEKWHSGWDAVKARRSDYVAMVENMDDGIAQVLKVLAAEDKAQDTLVIFTYDHGGRHLVNSGPLFHGFDTLWEGGIRVPLIMRWPGKFKAGHTISAPSLIMDITATALDASGNAEKIPGIDGKSFLDVEQARPDRAFFWKNKSMRAVRKGKWKYLVDGYTQMLFDLEQDVGERENVFYRHPEVVVELQGLLKKWEENVSD